MLTVIVPTCGRGTLEDSLTSIAKQAQEVTREVIVVGDGYQRLAEELTQEFRHGGMDVRYLSHGPTRNYGNAQRTFAQGISHGSHILYLDDDDIYAPEAFRVIEKAIKRETGPGIFIFKCIAPWGEVVWTEEGAYEQGNICTIQLVVENPRAHKQPTQLPDWPLRQGGNVPWTLDVAESFGASWRPEIISIARPKGEDIWWQS